MTLWKSERARRAWGDLASFVGRAEAFGKCAGAVGLAAVALGLAGCGHPDESDLRRENAVLKAQVAMLDAKLQDCRASLHDMIDVKDMVGSGGGIDAENESDENDSDSDSNIMSLGPMGSQSLGNGPIGAVTKNGALP